MKKIILFTFVILTAQTLLGQQDISLRNVMPPSPEASAFAKYGTYPCGTYTGRPDINIPIYEIKDGSLSVPISLSYDATGIRVNDMSSWVGMNWSLNAGGMVSQMVVGQPDLIDTSIKFAAIPPRGSEIVNNTTYMNYLQALVDADGTGYPSKPDAEPDKFFYSFNGRSGSFVLDRTRKIVQIPKTSLKISIIGSMQGFIITDESGTTYIFNYLEKTESYSYSAAGSSPSVSSSGSLYKNQTTGYYLTQILSSDGIQHIDFTYENEVTGAKDDSYSETYGPKFINSVTPQMPVSNYHEYRWSGTNRVITIPRLKTISFSNGKVDFARVSGRQDDAGVSSRLDEITIYNKNVFDGYKKLKSFKFVQGYYYSPDVYAQYSALPNQTADRYRLRLDTLKLKDSASTEISRYKFSYNVGILPPKTSCSQDWWGYNNGKPNTTLVPTTSIPDGNGGTLIIGNADRNANEVSMKAGILEKIVYPTGGYTIFETESHKIESDYNDVPTSWTVTAVGINSNNTNLVVQDFLAPPLIDNGSGKLSFTIAPYGASDPQPFVKIKNLSSGVEQIFTSPDRTQWYTASAAYSFVSGTTYELTASCYVNQSTATAFLNAVFTSSVYSPHTNPIGGLRIKSIRNYTADNILANQESYTYGPNENGGGVFVGVTSNAYSYGRGQIFYYLDNGSQCWVVGGRGGYVYEIYLGGPLFDPALVQGSPVVYTDVTKYVGTATGNAGKTMYNYGSASQQMAETRPLPVGNELANNQGILIINDAWKKGQLLTQQEYKFDNNTYSLVQDNQNTYNILYTDTTYGLIAQTNFDRIVHDQLCLVKSFTDYAFADYPVYSGYVQLAQSTRNDYSTNGVGAFQTIKNHTYDNAHKDIEVKTSTINSKGETIETEKKYPFNKTQLITSITPSESTTLDSMVSKNILSPVEEINRNNNVQVSLKKTSYGYVNTVSIAPVNVRFQNASYPIETRLSFPKYDVFGNLLEQQKVNDLKSSYIWDYQNRYPVASVSNASQTDIAYTSFEADGTGNWTFPSAGAVNDNSPLTGSKIYALSNYSITKSGLTSGRVYVLSYWARSRPVSYTGGTELSVTSRTGPIWTYYEHTLTMNSSTLTIVGPTLIDELRLYPKGALMTSYTYSPLVGATTINDPNSEITYYEYDGFQRLKNIKDFQGNIIKNYQYNYAQGCTSCAISMKTMGGTPTISYPVGVFSVTNRLLGNATTPTQYLSLWNADAANHAIGTLVAGSDSMHFVLNVNSGQASPGYVTGCRYYQFDIADTVLNGIGNSNGCYVDFGDGNNMKLGNSISDITSMVLAANTRAVVSNGYAIFIHSYPNANSKILTIYHNDGQETPGLSPYWGAYGDLTNVMNVRGCYPQNMVALNVIDFVKSSAQSVANITNWNSIVTITSFYADSTVSYSQDFMKNNRNLQTVQLMGGNAKMKLLKSDWNTYFTNLHALFLSNTNWNQEDLGHLLWLNNFTLAYGSPTITPAVADNIYNQIAGGSGRSVINGHIQIDGASNYNTSASYNAINYLYSKGWSLLYGEGPPNTQ